eukprot:NODE_6499_length_281_cov_500.137931_g5887_i0.p1 GENE.NODE_6499_length_281_cov_500.137931_g5887_i0~~NODE_6499_length_281_cov_500.137931_g5887_i0.p1  ORF type:complete len:71 (-),score=0.47 NODE_6499_length_281_cov_500.137931_g5887_i0:19-231(-)
MVTEADNLALKATAGRRGPSTPASNTIGNITRFTLYCRVCAVQSKCTVTRSPAAKPCSDSATSAFPCTLR